MKSQDPDQQRNLLLAVVLSMAVLLGWQLFYAGPKMKEEQARQRAQQELTQKEGATPDAAKPPTVAPAPGAAVPGAGAATPAPTVFARRLHQSFAAPRSRDALAQRLDRPARRPRRRPCTGEIPRDRRPQEPQRRALLPVGQPTSLLRRIRLHRPQRLQPEGAGRHDAVADAGKRSADPRGAGDADVGQWPGRHLQAHRLSRRRLHVQARRRN